MAAVKETNRSLLRVVKINDVQTHPKADLLDIAVVDGWHCVVKRDSIKTGDLALYAEVDSLLPLTHPIFSFLNERKENIKVYNDNVYSRIKTIKLRGVLSQGLILPLPDISKLSEEHKSISLKEGLDLTEVFGVMKYVSPNDVQYTQVDRSHNKGIWNRICTFIQGTPPPIMELGWPEFLKKSDEDRVQNLPIYIDQAREANEEFEVSVKLNGASMTIYSYEDEEGVTLEEGVCSRNHKLRTENVNYTLVQSIRYYVSDLLRKIPRSIKKRELLLPKFIRKLDVLDNLYVSHYLRSGIDKDLLNYCLNNDRNIALQGELCGPGIQSNYEELEYHEFFVYTAYEIKNNQSVKLTPSQTQDIVKEIDSNYISYIPVVEGKTKLPPTMKDILKTADGKLHSNPKSKKGREGVVYKSLSRDFSFKVISNQYLLKED